MESGIVFVLGSSKSVLRSCSRLRLCLEVRVDPCPNRRLLESLLETI